VSARPTDSRDRAVTHCTGCATAAPPARADERAVCPRPFCGDPEDIYVAAAGAERQTYVEDCLSGALAASWMRRQPRKPSPVGMRRPGRVNTS
jgi:hypothetical protein